MSTEFKIALSLVESYRVPQKFRVLVRIYDEHEEHLHITSCPIHWAMNDMPEFKEFISKIQRYLRELHLNRDEICIIRDKALTGRSRYGRNVSKTVIDIFCEALGLPYSESYE